MPDWYLYLIRIHNGSLYTGITTDVDRRFAEHVAGGKKAAKYFRGKGPRAKEPYITLRGASAMHGMASVSTPSAKPTYGRCSTTSQTKQIATNTPEADFLL